MEHRDRFGSNLVPTPTAHKYVATAVRHQKTCCGCAFQVVPQGPDVDTVFLAVLVERDCLDFSLRIRRRRRAAAPPFFLLPYGAAHPEGHRLYFSLEGTTKVHPPNDTVYISCGGALMRHSSQSPNTAALPNRLSVNQWNYGQVRQTKLNWIRNNSPPCSSAVSL